jgi:hypothetical protein
MIALGILAALLFAGFIMMVAGLRNAPEGYESQQGFHFIWCNRSPEIKNVVCIWDYQPEPANPAGAGLRKAA